MKNKVDDPTTLTLPCGAEVALVNLSDIEKDLDETSDEIEKTRRYYEYMLFFQHIIREYIPGK